MTRLLLIRELEFSIDDEHNNGHHNTQRADHKIGNSKEVILATHPGHIAEHHLFSSPKAQNWIVWGTEC